MITVIKKLKEISALCMQRQIWRRIVMTLSCIVVFVTTYMMILPAITLERNAAEAENGIEIDAGTIYFPENELSNNDGEEYREYGYGEADYTENAAAEDIGEGYLKNDEAEDDKQNIKSVAGTQAFMTGIQTVIGSDYVISAEVSENARIPADANLVVDELTGEMYESYYAQVLSNLGASEMPFARFFDIRFEINGDEIQPAADVNVTIELAEVLEDDVKAVHFEHEVDTLVSDSDDLRRSVDDEDLSNALDVEPEDDENRIETNKAALIDSERVVAEHLSSAVTFTANSFSVYGIVGTVIEKNVLASDGKNYKIIVTYGEDARIPMTGTELSVTEITAEDNIDSDTSSMYGLSYDEYIAYTENALGMEEGSARYIRLFDIKIIDQDNPEVKYQPEEGSIVDVRIELADAENGSLSVVHFADEGEIGNVVENITKVGDDGQVVEFQVAGFSIYAVVEDTKRLVYNFYNGSFLMASEYVRDQNALYDPGVESEYGQTFLGWAEDPNETDESRIYSIDQLNTQLNAILGDDSFSDGEEKTYYAIFTEAWYLRYMTQTTTGDAAVLRTVTRRKDAEDKTVTIDYTPDASSEEIFEGWIDVATGRVYQVNETITLDHHVDLYLKTQGRYWLVFDANAGGPGSGATYTPPQLLIGSEAVTTKPNDPVRKGYTFTGWNTKADGTGTWWYKADGSVNQFGEGLAADTTLYAQWEADDTEYYVVFWKQKTNATGTDPDSDYDYVSSEKRIAKTGTIVNTTNADKQKGNYSDNASGEYGYYFTYDGSISDTEAVVNADGTTTLNVHYDRKTITYNFTSTNGNFTIPIYTGVVDGETVVLTPDGNGGYTYQKTTTATDTVLYTGTRYSTTTSNSTTPQQYGWYGSQMVPLYYGRNSGSTNYWWRNYNYRRYTNQYTGQRYVEDTSGSIGIVDGALITLNSDGTYITNVTTIETLPYEGEVTTSTTTTNSASFSGLYGSSFSNWPDPGNGYVWQETTNRYLLPLALTEFNPEAAVSVGTKMTSVSFQRTTMTSNANLYVYKQKVDGNWDYSDPANLITTALLGNGGTWYPTETFVGFTIDGYRLDNTNGEWTSVTADGSITYGEGYHQTWGGSYYDIYHNVYLRYARNQHNIRFISQGPNTTGRRENAVSGIYYEANISQYGQDEDGTWYYEPTNGKDGYVFTGWYEDEACLIPFNFDTEMPDNDVIVYAKWETNRVRVVFVPTANNAHNDEVYLANNQSLTFRTDYGEKVSDENIKPGVAKRTGYTLIGWYTSPTFEEDTLWNFNTELNNNVSAVDRNYQNSDDWTNNTYGDNDGNHDNVKGILKLYAKWALDVDENSLYIEYDVDDEYRLYDSLGNLQTTIPIDSTAYLTPDGSRDVVATIGEAPSNYTDGFKFSKWVLQNADGSDSAISRVPGDSWEIPTDYSRYVEERVLTDDEGNSQTIKVIHFRAAFDIESENKATMVTFDGNGGVTNDSAAKDRVTEAMTVNKDFHMKDEDSFVREGYTLLGWAFQRSDGTLITAEEFKEAIADENNDLIEMGLYTPGQKVAADNKFVSDENNWEPLENIVYAVWEANTYSVTVKKVVDGEVTTEEFSFSVTADDDYSVSPENFTLQHNDTKSFFEVPYGTTFTIQEEVISGYSIKSVVANQVSKPDKTQLDESEYIDLEGSDGKTYTIKGDTVITYTNEKAKEQKLRIHKIGDDAEDGLAGATFSLTSSDADGFTDMPELVSMDGTASVNPGYLPSGDASDTTLFTLPSGNYTLTETEAPQYYEGIAGDIALSVTGDGISITSCGADEEAPFDGVSISEPDVDGVYTLTVTNTKKKGTVTVVKNVIGNDTDKDTEYRFTAKGLTQEDDEFLLHGRQLPENPAEGEAVTQENTKVYEDVPYGTVFSITEDTYGDFDTTIEISNEAESITDTRTATGNVTVDGDLTITYTNKRNKQPVAIYKTGLGEFETITTGASFVVYKASEFDDDTQSAIDEAVVVAQGTTNENGILILGKLPIESGEEFTEYRLVETTAPAGYDLPDYLMKIFVYPDKVFGMQATGNMLIKDAEDYSDITDKSTTVLRVWNNPGVVLPSTGGPGTNLIYLLGTILTAFAGVGLVMRKRQRDAA